MSTSIPANTRPLDGPPPRLQAPAGATDCHMHFYLPGYEPQPGGPPIAELATVADYRQVQKRLGLGRVVITQPNAYQFDNRALLQALGEIGPQTARAIIAVSPDMALADLAPLHGLGVRGARIMNMPGGAAKLDVMPAVERLVRQLGWSLIVQFNGRDIANHIDAFMAIESRYVIDHFGRFTPPVTPNDPGVDTVLRLIDRGNCWFKLCASNEVGQSGPPHYADMAAIARRVVAHAPERIIWGSNWPHVAVPRSAYPDDAHLLDLLLDCATAQQRQRILVDNPQELYGF
jgi:D-galactarolactone isomerase